MKIIIVYGSPCSGKTKYVREHAGPNDIIYDYDALIMAMSTRTEHIAEKHPSHMIAVRLRSFLVDLASNIPQIDLFWMICSWPSYHVLSIVRGLERKQLYIAATQEECIDRLMKDKTRPDKEVWKSVINDWFKEHEREVPT